MQEEQSGKVKWKSPSNIALVKYWGKHGRQLPRNPSISFTLANAHTITEISYAYNPSQNITLVNFSFEGKTNTKFEEKIKIFLESIIDQLPFLKGLTLNIESSNSFPHSSGIASSASAMSALAMCLLDIESQIFDTELDLQKASVISRLGSGSASRSVFPKIAIWGETEGIASSSDLYAIPYHQTVDEIFTTFHDDILIVSPNEKAVSSRAGHALMDVNPYATTRFEQANSHMATIISAMEQGDLETFGDIVEREALTLHALMMASNPPYILMEPNTIEAIRIIRQFRQDTNIPVYFTLDAGPNIHLLYPHNYLHDISPLKDSLLPYCVDGRIIKDIVGDGPEKME